MYDKSTIDSVFRSVLGSHGLGHGYVPHELHFKKDFIFEHTYANNLSQGLIDAMFPREAGPVELEHYTRPEGFRGIVGTGELRLYSTLKRLGEGEFDTFAREHKLDGYFDSLRRGGPPYYQDLMGDLFYSSLTPPGCGNEESMWIAFAEHGRGARLTLRVTPKAAELRPIQYQQGGPTILSELNDALRREDCPPFVPKSISKIGAFYLPLSYGVENELRLLIKRHREYFSLGMNEAESDGKFEFWPLPIGVQNHWCDLELLKVTVGPDGDRADLEQVLRSSRFADVEIA